MSNITLLLDYMILARIGDEAYQMFVSQEEASSFKFDINLECPLPDYGHIEFCVLPDPSQMRNRQRLCSAFCVMHCHPVFSFEREDWATRVFFVARDLVWHNSPAPAPFLDGKVLVVDKGSVSSIDEYPAAKHSHDQQYLITFKDDDLVIPKNLSTIRIVSGDATVMELNHCARVMLDDWRQFSGIGG